MRRSLGEGGLARVCEAVDLRSGRVVALKQLLRPDHLRHKALFELEYHTLKELSHPSLIEVYEYGLTLQGRPFYTMELLAGQDVKELAPLPWQEVCELLVGVASSLAVLHSRRLLHRDVSARNVRRTGKGQAKLIDFGAMCEMGTPAEITGTAPFMAPEAVFGQPLDGRTDLYSLGALA